MLIINKEFLLLISITILLIIIDTQCELRGNDFLDEMSTNEEKGYLQCFYEIF